MNAPTATSIQTLRNPPPAEAQLPAVRAGFFDLQGFELLQRVAKAFASSTLVPQQYQGNVPNCMIALNLARRLGADELMVMQNLYIVHGNPGWSSKFLIASVNTCGRYESLRYEWRGQPNADDFGCRAWTVERSTGTRLDGVWIDWKMVKAEGWNKKSGSKWLTMPDQMFVYRAAAFWQRAYAPEISMGLSTAEELADSFDAKRNADGSFSVDLDALRETSTPAASTVVDAGTGEIIEWNATAQAAEQRTAHAENGGGGAAPQNPGNGPTFEDAISAVNAGDFDLARDVATKLTDGQRQQVEAAIANKQKPAAEQQQAAQPRSRRAASNTSAPE
jgi:hypothetical protein